VIRVALQDKLYRNIKSVSQPEYKSISLLTKRVIIKRQKQRRCSKYKVQTLLRVA